MGDRQTRSRNAYLRERWPWVRAEETELTLRWLDRPVFRIPDPARTFEELTLRNVI